MTTKENKELWIGKRIISVDNEYITLDDGTHIYLDAIEFDE